MTWSPIYARSSSRIARPARRVLAGSALAGCLALALAAATGCKDASASSQGRALPALGAIAEIQGPVGPLPGGAQAQPVQNPYGNDAAALADGRRYFVSMNCSGCHGGHAGGGMGPSLRDEVWLYGGGDGDIFDSIAQGRSNGMPAWGSMLPADVIWRLAAYVRSLRTPAEPDPPRW
jgi:cytochrome c oxidase cbb3-type subunit 3